MPQPKPGAKPVANGFWESTRQLIERNEPSPEDLRTPQPWDQLMDLPPGDHLLRLVVWVDQLKRWGVPLTQDIWDRMVEDATTPRPDRPRHLPPTGPTLREQASRDPSLVYYLRVGRYIKIGYTRNLDERLRAYPPETVVLATEPGDERTERSRLDQFIDHLGHGREWFHPNAELIEHINSLRQQPLTAAELAA